MPTNRFDVQHFERMAIRATVANITNDTIVVLDNLPELSLHSLFDFLYLKNLANVSLESNRLLDMARDYFRQKFKATELCIKYQNNIIRIEPNKEEFYPFLDLIPNIVIYRNDATLLHSIGSVLKMQPKKITFQNLLMTEHGWNSELVSDDWMERIFENLQELKFIQNQRCGTLLDDTLRYCSKIRKLIIVTPTKANRIGNIGDEWYQKSYQYLEILQWDDGIINDREEFHILCLNNPWINEINVSRNILVALNVIDATALNLKKLCLEIPLAEAHQITSICEKLHRLYRNKIIKLHLTLSSRRILDDNIDDLVSLEGLEGLKFNGEYHQNIGMLTNLKHLHVKNLNAGCDASSCLQRLQKLHIDEADKYNIRPFIRRNEHLMELIVGHMKSDDRFFPDVAELSDDRMKLPNPMPLIIYLDESAYVLMKQDSTATNFIEIQRIESYQNNF